MCPNVNPLEYLHLQLRLEGKEVINGNLLRQVEPVPGEDMPLMVIGFLSTREQITYYDESLSPEFRERLDGQMDSVAFPNVQAVIHFLQSQGIAMEVGHFKTYVFPAHDKGLGVGEVKQYSKQDPQIQSFGFNGFAEKVYAIEHDGRIISACVSARENAVCGEAWVYTDENFRQQGLAQKVVVAWAKSLTEANKIPFYSHTIENIASANLARRLDLQAVFEEIAISG